MRDELVVGRQDGLVGVEHRTARHDRRVLIPGADRGDVGDFDGTEVEFEVRPILTEMVLAGAAALRRRDRRGGAADHAGDVLEDVLKFVATLAKHFRTRSHGDRCRGLLRGVEPALGLDDDALRCGGVDGRLTGCRWGHCLSGACRGGSRFVLRVRRGRRGRGETVLRHSRRGSGHGSGPSNMADGC
jgi:hypothetical protein